MSLAWDGNDVKPAGDGPMWQDFCAQVAHEMRVQQGSVDRAFADKVNRAQRGSNWRIWITAAVAVLFWLGCWQMGGIIDGWTR